MIRACIIGAVLALGAVGAQAQPDTNRPHLAIVCVDVNGALRPPACHQGLTTRINPTEDSCVCRTGNRVEASICPPGVAAPADSLAVNRARNNVLRAQKDLVGATYEGRPLCVAPETP